MSKSYELWTDGSCASNPGNIGGWAYVLRQKGCEDVKASGKLTGYVTNNISELSAVIHGLAVTLAGSQVILNSDSSYVVNGINKWRHGWKKYDFAGVKNAELWKEIDELVTARRVEAVWVRGHDGNIHNEECDRMASAAYREAS